MKYLLFLTFPFFVLSCSHNEQLDLTENKPISENAISLEDRSQDNLSGLPIPLGTIFTLIDDELIFQLPEGYELLGTTITGSLVSTGTGKVTCNCLSETGKCVPFETKDQVGCGTPKNEICQECEMKVSALNESEYEVLANYFIHVIENGDNPFFGLGGDPTFIPGVAIWNSLDWVTDEDIQEYGDEITSMIEHIESIENEGDITVLVPLSINNRKFLLEASFQSVEPGMIYTTTDIVCSGCDDTCYKDTGGYGKVRYCKSLACDSGCSLEW